MSEFENIRKHLGLYATESVIRINIDGYPSEGFDYEPIVELLSGVWPEISWVSTNCPPSSAEYASTHGIQGSWSFSLNGQALLPVLDLLVFKLRDAGLFDDRMRFGVSTSEDYAPSAVFDQQASA
jgi:hypothetical protein